MKKRVKRRVDPRTARMLRARRRKRHRMVFRILCCLLVCAATVFATTIFFRVSDIQVTGEKQYKASDLIAASGVEEGDNLFFLHTRKIAQVLKNTYPYLDEVSIKRHLPSTMEIVVTERKVLMAVEATDGTYYMDKQGKVLEKVSGTSKASVITAVGTGVETLQVGETLDNQKDADQKNDQSSTEAGYEKISSVLELLNLVDSYEILDGVRSVDITKSFDVKLNYNDCYTIEFGTLDNLEYKTQFLKAILKRDDLPETGIIDLSQGKEAHYRPAEVQTETTDSTDGEARTDDTQTQTDGETDGESEGEQTAQTAESTDVTEMSEDASSDTAEKENTDGEQSENQSGE